MVVTETKIRHGPAGHTTFTVQAAEGERPNMKRCIEAAMAIAADTKIISVKDGRSGRFLSCFLRPTLEKPWESYLVGEAAHRYAQGLDIPEETPD